MRPLDYNRLYFSLKKILSNQCLMLVFGIGGLILASLACSFQTQKSNSNGQSGFIPFTAEDCNIPWLTPPVTAEDEIYPVNIYCVYHAGVKLNGVVYLNLSYSANAADAKKVFDGWHQNIIDNYKNYDVIFDAPTDLFKMLVTPNKIGQNPTEDFASVVYFSDHFVVLIKGHVSNTSQADANGMVLNLVHFAMGIADDHYQENR